MHLTIEQLFKRAFLLIGLALVVVMLIFFNVNRVAISNELIALDLIPKPEKLTELYFNNNANLPGSVARSQTIHFTFVIHNLETTDYLYAYKVYINARNSRHIIDSGNVSVKNDQYYVKNEKVKLATSPGSQEVIVELTNKQQLIDFWTGK